MSSLEQKDFLDLESTLEGQRSQLPPAVSTAPDGCVSHEQSTYPVLLQEKQNPLQLLPASLSCQILEASLLWDWKQVQKHSRDTKYLSHPLLAQSTRARQTSVTEQNNVHEFSRTVILVPSPSWITFLGTPEKKMYWVYKDESGHTRLSLIS